MNHVLKNLPGGKKEISVTMSQTEVQPYFEKALTKIATEKELPGFRKGLAPKELVLERVGKAAVWEVAAERAITETMDKIIQDEVLEIIDSPRIEVIKLAPDNDLVFKAIIITLPKVVLGDYKKIKVAKPAEPIINNEATSAVIEDLRKMRAIESASQNPASAHDRVMIDMEMNINHVPIEGGDTKNHSVYLDETYYIPGLAEQLIGLKRGETKEFDLKFPDTHYKKDLANQLVHFKVKVNEVYGRVVPVANDEFAVSLGQKNLAELNERIRKNLLLEATEKQNQKTELEVLEKLIAISHFDELPDELIEQETNKMLRELEHNVTKEGMVFNDYLSSVKKGVDALKKEFRPEAEKRVKVALSLKTLKNKEQIIVSDAEILEEQTKQLNLYGQEPEAQKIIRGEEYQHYLENILSNKKTIQFLISQVVKN